MVTVMEILSPSNKVGIGRQEYLRKQQQLLSSGSYLVEIDLLRAGEHSVACPVLVFRYAILTLTSYWIYKLSSLAVTTMGGMRISLATAVSPHRCWPSTTRSGRSDG
jgi:hypothetical protein